MPRKHTSSNDSYVDRGEDENDNMSTDSKINEHGSLVSSGRETKGDRSRPVSFPNAKKMIPILLLLFLGLVVYDSMFSDPQNRIIPPDFSEKFLVWVQANPAKGLFAFILALAVGVITMIPIGTPLTLGCGYIYKGAYGWQLGLPIATAVSMGGSALGAVCCFLLGRYLMRDTVRQWVKKYPLFGAIDVATAEHGIKIMAMLYLTPVLPLGPVSYMCGTTSMLLSHFVIAKIASAPLMFFYCFIGASTGALITADGGTDGESVKSIEDNETLILVGIVMSFVMIAGITHQVKKELNKVLERQGKHKPGETVQEIDEEAVIEMGTKQVHARRRVA